MKEEQERNRNTITPLRNLTAMMSVLLTNAFLVLIFASAVAQGKKCYPVFSTAMSYKVGDWVSSTRVDIIMENTGEERKKERAYNYQCRLEASAKLCSSAVLAPGQPDSMWNIAWKQDDEECHTEVDDPSKELRLSGHLQGEPSQLDGITHFLKGGINKVTEGGAGDNYEPLWNTQTLPNGKTDIVHQKKRQLQAQESCISHTRFVKLEATTRKQIQMFEVRAFSSNINVAKGRNATQSSTYKNLAKFEARNAIDGNADTFSHTDDVSAWWQLDLGQEMKIDSVQILNRWCMDSSDPNHCFCRLSHANLLLLNDQGLGIATVSLGNTCDKPELVLVFCNNCVPQASRVQLLSNTGAPIQVFEVEVYSSGVNMAEGKTAMQSSTLKTFVAAQAIDGDPTTFSHTERGAALWEVDLGGLFPIESIKILNRWCRDQSDPNGCLCRLSQASLSLFDDQGGLVSSIFLGDTCGQSVLHVNTGDCADGGNIIILPVTLNDWAQLPFAGSLTVGEEGLVLHGSAYRVGNFVMSKQWFDLTKASMYFKWKARGTTYASWGPGILNILGAGFLTTSWSYAGSTVIPSNEFLYTKISCDVFTDPPICDVWTSTGNYIDHLIPSPTELRYDTFELTDVRVEFLEKAQLYWGFFDSYGGVNEYGSLVEAKIVNGTVVKIPKTSKPLFQGESSIPDSFTWSSGYSTCIWEVLGLSPSERVIKGSWLNGHSSSCSLKLNITDPSASGLSFSMKTEVDAYGGGEYAGLGILGISTNSESDWKLYSVPVTPSLVEWELRPGGSFSGNEFIYLKDIKLLVEQ